MAARRNTDIRLRVGRGRHHGAVQAQVNGTCSAPQLSLWCPPLGPRVHLPLARHRYLLCEVVSDDPRCRLSLDDRVLGGLVRDTIARVHGTFGSAACSIGFAGARVLGNWADGKIWREQGSEEGLRRGTSDPRSCQALCTILCTISFSFSVWDPEPRVWTNPKLGGKLIAESNGTSGIPCTYLTYVYGGLRLF